MDRHRTRLDYNRHGLFLPPLIGEHQSGHTYTTRVIQLVA
jgi:hypothetical protein